MVHIVTHGTDVTLALRYDSHDTPDDGDVHVTPPPPAVAAAAAAGNSNLPDVRTAVALVTCYSSCIRLYSEHNVTTRHGPPLRPVHTKIKLQPICFQLTSHSKK